MLPCTHYINALLGREKVAGDTSDHYLDGTFKVARREKREKKKVERRERAKREEKRPASLRITLLASCKFLSSRAQVEYAFSHTHTYIKYILSKGQKKQYGIKDTYLLTQCEKPSVLVLPTEARIVAAA